MAVCPSRDRLVGHHSQRHTAERGAGVGVTGGIEAVTGGTLSIQTVAGSPAGRAAAH
jgi:hypothetical protein